MPLRSWQRALPAALILPLCLGCDSERVGDVGPGVDPSQEFDDGAGPQPNLPVNEPGSACEFWAGEIEPEHALCSNERSVQLCTPEGWSECVPADDCEEGEMGSEALYPDQDWCAGIVAECVSFSGVPLWREPFCAPEDQGGDTPLVLRFDDVPVRYQALDGDPKQASFAAGGRCTTNDWPTADTPWLALDRNGNGFIDGGAELFGSGTALTSGAKAAQGFAALEELDSNRDGVIDAADPAFAQLALWGDRDGDRFSQPGELMPLSERGVSTLSLDYEVRSVCDARGNCGRERATFESGAGVGEIVDVHLPCR